MADNLLNPDKLQLLWQAHGLGTVQTVEPAKRGMNNRATVVNDAWVIRFDLLDLDGVCRYAGEQLAYERLRANGIPAPEVVALDVSKTLVPYHYMILTKSAGRPLIDDWANFTPEQQAEAGRSAGRYLALLHEITFHAFGNLSQLDVPRWYDHVEEFFERYAAPLTQTGIIHGQTYTRMRACVDQLRPRFDLGAGGRLVHSDYQFENLLHTDGVITAIIDFEWAVSGDPAWDFKLDEQWDSDCPGSGQYIHEGYTSVRPLASDHHLRVWLYKLLWYLDSIDMYAHDFHDADMLAQCHANLLKTLAALEHAL